MDVWIPQILAWIEELATGWAPMGDWAQPMGLNQLPIVQEYALVIEVSSAPRAASCELWAMGFFVPAERGLPMGWLSRQIGDLRCARAMTSSRPSSASPVARRKVTFPPRVPRQLREEQGL